MSDSPQQAAPARHRRSPLAIVLVASLVAATLVRQFVATPARASVESGSTRPAGDASSSPAAHPVAAVAANDDLGSFNSYTLGLLLGGLRGPLVMTLWSTTESQKSHRDLEDINTKIELIRLLQPNFDTVHIFQIWNKAYNLSVQMSNLPSKYSMILDAIDYAHSVTASRPANLNIEVALGGVYFDKLGNSAEKTYYRERVRQESQAPQGQTQITFPAARRDEFVAAATAAGLQPTQYVIRPISGTEERFTVRLRADYGSRVSARFFGPDVAVAEFAARRANSSASLRQTFDTLLDADGRLLPAYYNRSAPTRIVADDAWHPEDGPLAELARFEPFPYGVSPFALAYAHYKHAVELQVSLGQRHAQMSEGIVSSRAALSLAEWTGEERERALRAEIVQFGIPIPDGTLADRFERPAEKLDASPVEPSALATEAIYSFDRAAAIADAAVQEFDAHMRRYPEDSARYRRHRADVRANGELSLADGLFLQAKVTADPVARAALQGRAADAYKRSIDTWCKTILAFYTTDELANEPGVYPKGYGKADALNALETPASFPEDQLVPTVNRVRRLLLDGKFGGQVSEVESYARSLSRAQTRIQTLSAATSKPAR